MGLKCIECDLEEDQHHKFTPPNPPPGCKCEVMEWSNPQDIPAVCAVLVMGAPDTDDAGLCVTCQHLAECHADATKGDPHGR